MYEVKQLQNVKHRLVLVDKTLKDVGAFFSLDDQAKLNKIALDLQEVSERHEASSRELWEGINKSLFLYNDGDANMVWKHLEQVIHNLNYTEFEYFVESNMDLKKDLMWNFTKIKSMGKEMLDIFPAPPSELWDFDFDNYVSKCRGLYPESDGFGWKLHSTMVDRYQFANLLGSIYFPYVAKAIYMHLAYGFIKKALQE